jgi:hypothetical protein
MASDAQVAQNQMYWRSATPIAISEATIRYVSYTPYQMPFIKLKNSGNYPIRITKLIGGSATLNATLDVFYGYTDAACGFASNGYYNISDFFYLSPGEERYFNFDGISSGCKRLITFTTGSSGGYSLGRATTVCENSTTSPGYLTYKTFGFEYIAYIDGQQITKRQIGSVPFTMKCQPAT